MEIQSRAYPFYREIGERVLELIAPPDTEETPLKLSCRPESVGMFVETVISQGLADVVNSIPVEALMAQEEVGPAESPTILNIGERVLRAKIQERVPTFELHRANRADMAHLTAALNYEGLWPAVANVIQSAKEAQAYFEIEKKEEIEVEQERQARNWRELTLNGTPEFLKPKQDSALSKASTAELESALTWLQGTALSVVESHRGIPQYMVPSSVRSEVNERLRELMGHTDSEKLEMFHDIVGQVRGALSVAASAATA